MALAEDPPMPRDPFWPVGYEKPKPPDPEEEVKEGVLAPREDQAWPDLPVQGVSRGAGGAYFALIKGVGVVSAGDDVSIEKEGVWYHWHIDQIGAGGIRARKLGVSADRATVPRPATPAGNGQPVKE
jgi:hypothetical protein